MVGNGLTDAIVQRHGGIDEEKMSEQTAKVSNLRDITGTDADSRKGCKEFNEGTITAGNKVIRARYVAPSGQLADQRPSGSRAGAKSVDRGGFSSHMVGG